MLPLLWELGQIEIGVGTLVTTNKRIDAAVNKSVSSLKNGIQQTQTNIHCDETPWVVKGVKEGLWIFANTNFALFHAADTRTRAELETILGLNYNGVLSSDEYSVDNSYDVKAQQKCLAHLRRHFEKLIQLPGLNNQKIGEKFVKLIDKAFQNYSLFQQNQNISELFGWAWEFKLKVKPSLDKWMAFVGGKASHLLRSLRNKTDLRVVFFRPSRGTSRQ